MSESDIPQIDIEGIRCVSGHFQGVFVQPDGSFAIQFCIREGFDGGDLFVLTQEVQNEDDYTLDKAVQVGRKFLAYNLEQLAQDIRTGEVSPDSDEDIERLEKVEQALKDEAEEDVVYDPDEVDAME